jgi:hypothetical protein
VSIITLIHAQKPHVGAVRKKIDEPVHETRRKVLIKQQSHAAATSVCCSRSAA